MASKKWRDRLRKVLVDHLLGTGCFLPGGDNIKIEDVLRLFCNAFPGTLQNANESLMAATETMVANVLNE